MPKAIVPLLAAALLALGGLAGCGGDDGGEAEPEAITPETGIDPGAGSQNFSVALNPAEGESHMGSAQVTAAAGERVRVTIQLDGAQDEALPAEIREGTCEDLGAHAVHELSEVEEGRSETVVDTSMEELRTTPYSIVVGGDHSGRDAYHVCGELVGTTGE